ncbi:MAG: thermonuclease family protein [Patescibacteria group bacterium]|nr:thermonuclease family protein [Patescibacteria group bacterium]MDE1988088.1 thermonuclease family protein [Patescibacteria group bacterium]MDE2218193.1 thermonuclease family protein [Patescibacteria group bacterium]
MKCKKYKVWVAFIFALLPLAVWFGAHYGNDEIYERDRIKIGNFSAGVSSKKDSSTREKFSQNAEDNRTYLVKRAIDGDTIELEGGERVRYIGIDTPETVDPRKPVQCFGKEAARANRELVEGKLVRLEKDVSDKDKYGRLLRYVYQGEKFINLELVEKGYAYAYTYPPDVKKSKIFIKEQEKARQNRLGLWEVCPQKI